MKHKGFTLIELLLSVAMISLILGISAPLFQSLQVRNDLDIAGVTFAQTARRAQMLARASDGDTSWGVYISSGSSTLFKGGSYSTRDLAYDEIFTFSTSITPSGLSEIVYTKFTGLPQSTGTVTLTSTANETRILTINAKGTVSY